MAWYRKIKMGKPMRRKRVLATAAGAMLAVAIAGGVAWASIPGDGGVIQGCYTKVGGVLRVIDTAGAPASVPFKTRKGEHSTRACERMTSERA